MDKQYWLAKNKIYRREIKLFKGPFASLEELLENNDIENKGKYLVVTTESLDQKIHKQQESKKLQKDINKLRIWRRAKSV